MSANKTAVKNEAKTASSEGASRPNISAAAAPKTVKNEQPNSSKFTLNWTINNFSREIFKTAKDLPRIKFDFKLSGNMLFEGCLSICGEDSLSRKLQLELKNLTHKHWIVHCIMIINGEIYSGYLTQNLAFTELSLYVPFNYLDFTTLFGLMKEGSNTVICEITTVKEKVDQTMFQTGINHLFATTHPYGIPSNLQTYALQSAMERLSMATKPYNVPTGGEVAGIQIDLDKLFISPSPNDMACETDYANLLDSNIEKKYMSMKPSDMAAEMDGSALQKDLENLFKSNKLSDITLEVGLQRIPAHKSILGSRSKFFANLFQEYDRTQNIRVIIVNTTEPNFFNEILYYIYSGKASSLNEIPFKWLIASDKFGFQHLKIMSEYELFHKIQIKNVVGILAFADKHNAKNLKRHAIAFIAKHLTEVTATDGWQYNSKNNPELMAELRIKLGL